jgi:polygalacturonase
MKRFLVTLIAIYFLINLSAANKAVYNIMDYGAIADTTILSTNAIQKAIDECAKNGGGVVWVPSGNYLTTSVVLRSNVNLHLDAGSALYASRRVSDYKNHKIKVGASDAEAVEVILIALNENNISVTGTGKLHCQAVREQFRREPQLAITDFVTGREIDNAIKYGADYRTKYRKVPPCPGAINFTDCTNVHIKDVEVIESSFWAVHLQWCDRVYVDGIHIQSSSVDGVNSDGLDIDGCSNVMISNCVINTGDDALCLKTTRQNNETRPCRWITVNNCILTSSSAALKIGTESHADFENIAVSNCIINDANRGLNMIIRDGGNVRNVLFTNIVINTVRKATFWWGNGDAVWLTTQKRSENIPSAGVIENITFNHIIAHGQSGVRLEGFDSEIKNIRFNNFQLFMEPENAIDKRARDGFLFHKVNKLSMIDCEVIWNKEKTEAAWESAYFFENVDKLNLVRTIGEQAPNKKYPAFRFKKVSDMNGKPIK